MALVRFIITRNVHLERKNALIVAKKNINIHTAKNPKVKRRQKLKIQLTTMENKELNLKRKFVTVQMSDKNIKFQLDTVSDLSLINEYLCYEIILF